MKVEIPINMKYVEGAKAFSGDSRLHTRRSEEAVSRVREGGDKAVHLPVGRREQRRVHRVAGARLRSGVRYSGVLCGRATWKDGISVYAKQGGPAFRDWLESKGVENIENVNAALKSAAPWFSFYGATSASALSRP